MLTTETFRPNNIIIIGTEREEGSGPFRPRIGELHEKQRPGGLGSRDPYGLGRGDFVRMAQAMNLRLSPGAAEMAADEEMALQGGRTREEAIYGARMQFLGRMGDLDNG